METPVLLLIILGAISGLSHGAGILPDSLTSAVGGTVMFAPKVTPPETPFLVVTWRFSDAHSTSNIITSTDTDVIGPVYKDRVTFFRSNASLELRNLTSADSGEYTVITIPDGGAQQTGNCKLVICVPVSKVVVTLSSADLVEFNSSVRLSCSSSGSSPSFHWLNGSSEVTQSDRVQLTDGGANLTITNVTRYDEGQFSCQAFNPVSDDKSEPVNISISYGPENVNLTLSPSQEHYEEGSDVNLMCSAVSRPSAQFMWFLNEEKLTDTGPEFRLINIQMSQSGDYSCQAFNTKTLRYEMSQPAAVYVLAQVSSVVVTSNNTHLSEFSSSVRLSCSSSGSSPSFCWLNGSSEVTQSDRVQLTDGGATLTIASVTRYDEGPFRCNVSNGVSSEISQPVTLFIQYGPDNMAIKGPESVHVGDFVMLYCSTMSVPSAMFTWLFNEKPTSIHESVYIIPSTRSSNSGTYTCTAVNAATGQSQTVNHKLTVIDFSDCDCTTVTGRASIITAGCCVIIAAVSGIIAYGLIRRNHNQYPAQQKAKLSRREKHTDSYRISVTSVYTSTDL
ncbi:cell adhesion molecule CEACAM5-like [Pempheris klunzingeri]|uniref:cell adhesion molecule CEACAM5-like n=1 Tax=Pempheris klunzingeri TaxID=3127111 RepID=UPI003981255B